MYGMLLGGVVVASLGGVAEYVREKEIPSYKGMVRDFLVGAMLVLFLLQILPDSMISLIDAIPTVKNLTDKLPSVGSITGGGMTDMGPDLQIGLARF